MNKINAINGLLRNATREMNFIFIDNSNIKNHSHLWDNVHLNNEGLNILRNNFVGALRAKSF